MTPPFLPKVTPKSPYGKGWVKVYRNAVLPSGFKANGMSCGIKKSGKPDLALLYSQNKARASCLFTRNKIQAAPIRLNKLYLKRHREFRAIIINSGCANSFTGKLGFKDAQGTGASLAKTLGIKKEEVLVASTGIIGERLPLAKIKKAFPELVNGLSGHDVNKVTQAILTTDKFSKEITLKFNLGNSLVTICGIAKGAGMIAPDMATMLCFILTDANIAKKALDKALKIAADNSFNCITVDGCMSTNDTLMVLANGAAANKLIDAGDNFNIFLKALEIACLELAKMIIKDAEGASKFIKIKVTKARSFSEAKRAALSIANSNLFKSAMYGESPNFGRIISALGASGIDVQEKGLKVGLSSLKDKEIKVEVSLNKGHASAIVYTSDLTPEYIKINATYN